MMAASCSSCLAAARLSASTAVAVEAQLACKSCTSHRSSSNEAGAVGTAELLPLLSHMVVGKAPPPEPRLCGKGSPAIRHRPLALADASRGMGTTWAASLGEELSMTFSRRTATTTLNSTNVVAITNDTKYRPIKSIAAGSVYPKISGRAIPAAHESPVST